MRKPPKLYRPQPDEEIGAGLRLFAASMEAAMLWMLEAVEKIEAAQTNVPPKLTQEILQDLLDKRLITEREAIGSGWMRPEARAFAEAFAAEFFDTDNIKDITGVIRTPPAD